MTRATMEAVYNGGEWHHIADEWSEIEDCMVAGEEVLVGQCEDCGGYYPDSDDHAPTVLTSSKLVVKCMGCLKHWPIETTPVPNV